MSKVLAPAIAAMSLAVVGLAAAPASADQLDYMAGQPYQPYQCSTTAHSGLNVYQSGCWLINNNDEPCQTVGPDSGGAVNVGHGNRTDWYYVVANGGAKGFSWGWVNGAFLTKDFYESTFSCKAYYNV